MGESTHLTGHRCTHCGAAVRFASGAQSALCEYCGSRLELPQSNNQIAHDLQALRLQQELERLDRDWLMQRQQWLITGKHGGVRTPSATGSIGMAAVAAVFGIFWTILTFRIGAPFPFPLFGLIFIVVAVVSGIRGVEQSARYREAADRYEARRRRLLDEIRQRGQ